MKQGDYVHHKPQTIAKGGVQKQGIVIELGRKHFNGRPEDCVLGLWDYPGVGLRWLPASWLEVINETR